MKTDRHFAFRILAAVVTVASAQTYTFTTIGGSSGRGSADGKGSSARFHHPSGVAVDGSGNVFIADGGNHTKISPRMGSCRRGVYCDQRLQL
jgi:hypothetical protein